MIAATREINGEASLETRHSLFGRAETPERANAIVRSHWSIENRLHWILDAVFDEDQARNRKDHGSENLAFLRKLALNLARLDPSNGSMKGKYKRAGWEDAYLTNLIARFSEGQVR